MTFIQGIAEIRKGFAETKENFDDGGEVIARKIEQSWVLMIHLTDAIDKGNYLRAIDSRPVNASGEMQQFVVDTENNSEVIYSGFVEGGTKYMAARFPAQKGIEREDFVQTILDFADSGLAAHSD